MPTNPNKRVGRLRASAVRMELLRRGLTVADLAQQLGISGDTLSARLSDGKLPLRAQARVEWIFEFKEPIWSTPRELALRELCFTKTGTDPAQLSLPELKNFAEKLHVTFRFHDSRAAVLGAILDHAAAHPLSLKI